MTTSHGRSYKPGTEPDRRMDPPDVDVCPEDCGFLENGECLGDPPTDCQGEQAKDDMDAKYEAARDMAMEES